MSIARSGATFALHSDYNLVVAPMHPLTAVWIAVNRIAADNKTVVAPGECISVEQALRAVTIDEAFVAATLATVALPGQKSGDQMLNGALPQPLSSRLAGSVPSAYSLGSCGHRDVQGSLPGDGRRRVLGRDYA